MLGIVPQASGEESLRDLEERMEAVQAELDAATVRIESLRTEEEDLRERLRLLDLSLDEAERRAARNEQRAVETARNLYMGGSDAFLEVLLSSEDVAALSAASEYMTRVSETNADTFVKLARTEQRLRAMRSDIAARLDELAVVRASLTDESPRSGGRTHEGTDVMAAFGTRVVAVVDGTVTFAGYGSSAGNWIVLAGNDGNSFWYMHNQENLTSGGPVRAGELIATVGDTGNAVGGPPHVHFEYHPGGGGPVNPYPILTGPC